MKDNVRLKERRKTGELHGGEPSCQDRILGDARSILLGTGETKSLRETHKDPDQSKRGQ